MRRSSKKATTGDDSIPSYIIRNCRETLAKLLCIIINLSLQLNVFLEKWKNSRIVPVVKKGNTDQLQSYRLISVVDNFANNKIY